MFDETFGQFLIMAFGAISVFSLIAAVGYLFLKRDKRAERVKMIAMRPEEFDRLQRERTEADQAKRLRHRMRARMDVMRTVLERFKLQQMAASRDLRLKLAAAGLRHPSAPLTYVFTRFAMAVGAVLILTLFTTLSEKLGGSSIILRILLIAGAAGIGYALPAVLIKNATVKRQQAMTEAFPDMLDMLLICVESGLSINAAFARVAEETADTAPILSREIALLSAEMSFLGDRRAAYQNFADRTGLQSARTLATSLNQADRYGTPVGTALQVLAEENRALRLSVAEKKAASLPAKLTVPMVVFFLPALFIVMLAPPSLTVFLK